MVPSAASDVARSSGVLEREPVIHLAGEASIQQRVLDAMPRCVARWGVAKTTVDDIAREAGCSRASVYRAFPGGKDELLDRALAHEEARFFAALTPALEAPDSLEDLLVEGFVGASRLIRENEALQYLLAHEPEVVLPHIAFDRIGPLLARVAAYTGPFLERFLPPETARETAEWITRLVLSHALAPSEHLDPCDEGRARRCVQSYVLPGVRASSLTHPHERTSKGEPHVLHR